VEISRLTYGLIAEPYQEDTAAATSHDKIDAILRWVKMQEESEKISKKHATILLHMMACLKAVASRYGMAWLMPLFVGTQLTSRKPQIEAATYTACLTIGSEHLYKRNPSAFFVASLEPSRDPSDNDSYKY
jgi:hypothetical protein